jgi:hypothetical protein
MSDYVYDQRLPRQRHLVLLSPFFNNLTIGFAILRGRISMELYTSDLVRIRSFRKISIIIVIMKVVAIPTI